MNTSATKSHMIVSKFYRLKMGNELFETINMMPIHSLKEISKGDHVYKANGLLKIDEMYVQVRIRVWVSKTGQVKISIRAPEVKLRVVCPYDTELVLEKFRIAMETIH